MYNLGFAIYTVFSLLLAITWLSGPAAAWYLILMRVGQGVGAAFLMANSSAILTDAFPEDQRGWPSASNQVAALAGSFIGWCWRDPRPDSVRLIFVVSVPHRALRDRLGLQKSSASAAAPHQRIDWPGNITFALV